MKKRIFSSALSLVSMLALVHSTANAQCTTGPNGTKVTITGQPCSGTIQTATVFLRIAPDARGGAMGDAGIATGADANSIHYNASKSVFADQETSISATYTPWLQGLGVNDIYLAYLAGYKQFGSGENKQAINFELGYFSLGKISWTDDQGLPISEGSPRELVAAASYARQLGKNLAIGGTVKYVYSNLASGLSVGGETVSSGQAGAVDISLTYNKPLKISGEAKKADLRVGLAISNIGNKINYVRTADFLPANLGLGAGFTYHIDKFNDFTVALDINKLLVPSPDSARTWRNKSPIEGIFSSFGDAAGGGKEELQELMYSLGLEYWYDKQFAVRAGYFYEHKNKGGRQYFTAGLGLRYNFLGINMSYLVPTSSQRGPLDNTLRFSLLFDLNSFKAESVDN
ncbi:MAG: hypothetical protein RL757_38 [Bacteroidota bacterium]|jgi:hypothetical protein